MALHPHVCFVTWLVVGICFHAKLRCDSLWYTGSGICMRTVHFGSGAMLAVERVAAMLLSNCLPVSVSVSLAGSTPEAPLHCWPIGQEGVVMCTKNVYICREKVQPARLVGV